MFSQAPIVVAARGTGLFNMASSFSASVLISVILFCKLWDFIIHFTLNQNKLKNKIKYKGHEKKMVEVPQKALYTKVAKANARGNAQANIMIIPNCKASSKQSAGES